MTAINKQTILGTVFIIMAAIMAGLEPIVTKLLLADNDPLQIIFSSRIIASVLLLPLLPLGSIKTFSKKQWLRVIFLGFLWTGVVSPLFYTGLELTTSLSASLIQYSYPFLVAILAWFFLKEKITVPKAAGTMLIIAGIFLILVPGIYASEHSSTIGNLIVMVAMVIGAIWVVLAKLFLRDFKPEVFTATSLIVGSCAVAIYLKGEIIPIINWEILALGVIIALFWLFYFRALKHLTAMKVTAIESTAPFFTAIFTVIIFIKIPGFFEIAALFLVLPGLLLLAKEE